MQTEKQPKKGKPRLFLETIMTAAQGNSESLEELIEYFLPYIITLAKTDLYDAAGNKYYYVDEDIRHQLETKLIIAAMKFEIT